MTVMALLSVSVNASPTDFIESKRVVVGTPSTDPVIFAALSNTTALSMPMLVGCNADDTRILNQVVPQSVEDVLQRRTCLREETCPSEYNEWMGERNDSRYSAVQSCIGTLSGYLSAGNYRLQCDSNCRNNPLVYAIVNSADPLNQRNIQLCGGFWMYPAEQANTIVHELCHFKSSCDFRDAVYGKDAVRQLAITSPNIAVTNPDNYAYFTDRFSN